MKADDSSVVCWGRNDERQSTPPAGPFLKLSSGAFHSCEIKTDGTVACWGDNERGEATPPAGGFRVVSAGFNHTCGVESGGRGACWGNNDQGQSTPPAVLPPLVNVVAKGCSPCRAGDVVEISLDFSNPGPKRIVELTAVSHSPDGVTVVPFVAEDLEVELPPGQFAITFQPVTIPAGLPIGTYYLEAVLLDNVTSLTLSRHSVPVEVVP